MIGFVKKNKLIFSILLLLFGIKILSNWLLLAENGDTYDFFKIAYFFQNYNLDYASKRMPLLPLLLTPFPSHYFVAIGRVWINIFYFLTVVLAYKYFYSLVSNKVIRLKSNKEISKEFISFLFAAVIATNILIFENSYYILADTIFLFFNVLYLYMIRKDGLDKPFLLALISALAFYTRPEGMILFLITGLLYLIALIKNKANVKSERLKVKQILLQAIIYGVIGLVLIAPYFLRNYYYYNSFFYSGYLEDEAGFLFDKVTIMQRFSNFLYAVGGVWLLPTLYILFKSWDNKFRISNLGFRILNVDLHKSFLPEALVFIVYSLALFIWGPYPRLYTIPTFLALTLVYYLLANIQKIKIKWQDIIIVAILTSVSILFYVYAVQFLDQTDYGYRKVGKAAAIILSLPMILYFYLYHIQKISKKTLIVLFTVTLILINLVIFVDKFRITRYKYYTIKQATLDYIEQYSKEGNLGYDSLSDVETWYLRDFNGTYDFIKTGLPMSTWAKENNIKYLISTEEGNFNDKIADFGKLDENNSTVVKRYKSPFFPGETILIRIDKY